MNRQLLLASVALALVGACVEPAAPPPLALIAPGSGAPPPTTDPPPTCGEPTCPDGQLPALGPDGAPRCVVPACTSDQACPTGTACAPATWTCVPVGACEYDDECGVGERCVAGDCVPDRCDRHDQCPHGLCVDGVCAPPTPCTVAADCAEGWTCPTFAAGGARICVPIAQTCGDCAPGFTCDAADVGCVPIERACGEDCPTGLCVDGACRFCDASAPCADGLTCAAGYCVEPGCATDLDCGDGVCVEGLCQARACEPVETCDGGRCRTVCETPRPDETPRDLGGLDGAAARAPVPGSPLYEGTLDVIVLPPPGHLDFGAPVDLIASALASSVRGDRNVADGKAELAHFIGHIHVEMLCTNGLGKALRIPLTGFTSGGNKLQGYWDNFRAASGGMGVLFYPFPGALDEGNPKVAADLQKRARHPGMMSRMRFPLDHEQCVALREHYQKVRNQVGQMVYSGHTRPRRLEGAGCTAFGQLWVELSRLLPRSKMVDEWAQQLGIGMSTIANSLDVKDLPRSYETYPYGSNLVAWLTGRWHRWPRGQGINAGKRFVRPTDLVNWRNGDEDFVPLTIFDAERMTSYINAVHARTKDAELWDAITENDGNVNVIVRKRPGCGEALPRNPDDDDLRKD